MATLADRTLMSGWGHSHFARAEGLPLSLKCMFNGSALYKIGRAEFCVDDGGYMVVNQGQPYSIEIASPTKVRSFIVWFPEGWAQEVAHTLQTRSDVLLSDPDAHGAANVSFFERYIPNNSLVTPRVRDLFAASQSSVGIDDGWLEERLRELLAALLWKERGVGSEVAQLSAARLATRQELWRRLQGGRDFLRARSREGVSLAEAARAACLSPYHFLRSFKQAFGCTPHQHLTRCRIERAKFLLQRTELPVTDICFEAGFVSLGSFSTLFHRSTGLPPRLWRAQHAHGRTRNRKIREVFLRCNH